MWKRSFLTLVFPGRASTAIIAGLCAAANAYAGSDVGPPVRLGPPPPPAARADTVPPAQAMQMSPNSASPGSASGVGPDDQGQADALAGSRSIMVGPLAPPDPEAAGALSKDEAALPSAMWQGSSIATVMSLFPRIGSTTSPALQDLTFRLLASPAAAPEGDAPAGALIALRAERLTSVLGRAGSALTLLQGAASGPQSEAAGQIAVDLAFLEGDLARACTLVQGRDRSWQETYWDQGMVTCEALGGKDADARVGLDVLREDKFKDDGFSALVDVALTGGATARPLDTLPSPQPMAIALLNKAHCEVPHRVLDSSNLALLRAVALGEGFPPEERLAAAEKAAIFGAISPPRLAAIYLATPLTAQELSNPLNQAQSSVGAHGRAILFHALRDATQPGAKAGFLLALLDKSPRADLYLTMIRAARPMLLALEPDPSLSEAAAEFARALYALDRPVEAGRWLALASPDSAQSLLPLSHIVDDKSAPPWGTGDLADGLKRVTRDPSLAERRAILAVQLLAADGTPVPTAALLSLFDAHVHVPPNAVPGLLIQNEAAAMHLGPTVLAVDVALGDQGALASGFTIAQAVAGLRTVGLPEDARRLAIDAAISAGL